MSRSRCAAITLIAIAIGACSGEPARAPTSPEIDSKRVQTTASICDNAYDAVIASEQDVLFDGDVLIHARQLWSLVTTSCDQSNPGPARENMLAYVRFTILAARSSEVLGPTPEQSIVNHWNPAFQYVGHARPEVPAGVLTSTGAARVVLANEGTTEFGIPLMAAMTVRKQDGNGVQGGRLFTIRPDAVGCIATTNLVNKGPCFDFSVYPEPEAAEVSGKPYLVGICEHETSTRPALGHRAGGGVEILDPDAVPNGAYPSLQFCSGTQQPAPPQFGGFIGFLRRVASFPAKLISVSTAFAGHGGLGGLGGSLSPFGAVERRIFSANFSADAIGSTPPENTAGYPDIGVWSRVFATPPGSVLVQATLGTSPNSLDRPVVLRQAGGACAACGGLDLWGQAKTSGVAGAFADAGVYVVRWRSLQSSANVKEAPFVVRSAEGLEVARVTYLRQSGKNLLKYNNSDISVQWVRNVAQSFLITVDLSNRTTSLSVDGTPVAGAQNQPFVSGAANVHRVQAEFSGVDSGVMGWDDIEVERLPDQ